MAVLVLQNIVACLKEMVIQGQPVKLDGFGTFSPSIESDGKRKAGHGGESLLSVSTTLIAGVHLRFVPEELEGVRSSPVALKEE